MKKLLFAGLLSVFMAKVAVAQDFDFNEMEYTPHQTTFQLFASPTAKSVKVLQSASV